MPGEETVDLVQPAARVGGDEARVRASDFLIGRPRAGDQAEPVQHAQRVRMGEEDVVPHAPQERARAVRSQMGEAPPQIRG